MRLILSYFLLIALGILIFPVLFNTPIFHSVNLLFYKGIALASVCIIVQASLILFFQKLRFLPESFSFKDYLCVSALTFSFNISFLIILPVTFERSISTFLLASLSQETEKGLTQSEMEERLIKTYVLEKGAVPLRMQEQLLSGNVIQVGNRYILTRQGINFLKFGESIKFIYAIDPMYERVSQTR